MHFYIDPILLLWLRNKIPLSENITQLFQDKIELFSELKSITQTKAGDYSQFTEVSPDDYLNRIKILKIRSTNTNNKYFEFEILEYEKLLTLGTGNTFGDVSLSNVSTKRYYDYLKH